jgi:hypothetical protein
MTTVQLIQRPRSLSHVAVRILAGTAVAWGVAVGGVQADPATAAAQTQSTSALGVTVKITARSVAADVDTWVFTVVLETHSQELADDLLQTVVLRTDDGRQIQPSAWKGGAPSGHHREGTLEFAAPKPHPRSVELTMQRAGETAPRSFRFSLAPAA